MIRRSPIRWPDDARIALVPVVPFEIWPEDLGMRGSLNMTNRSPFPPQARFKKDLSVITDRQYGERAGIFRLMDLFENEAIRVSFLLSGIVAEKFPELVKEIKGKGHEIVTENYIHDYEYMKTYEEEKNDIRKAKEAIEKVIGEIPRGYITPGNQPTENTPVIIAEEGLTYFSSFQHEDLPYTLKVGNKALVVLPYVQYLNDFSTYNTNAHTPRQLLEIWKDCFDYLYEEGEAGSPKMMGIWGVHPFLSGRPYRAGILREFIRYAKGRPRVWFARGIDVVEWWLKNYKDSHVEEWPNCLRMVDPPYVSKASMTG